MKKIEQLFKSYLSPVKFLSLSSVTIAGISAFVSILNARLLGPEVLGLIGILSGINATVGNFLDVRLMDVVGKLYYLPDLPDGEKGNQYRFSVLVIYILGTGLLGLIIWGGSLLAGIWTLSYFTQTPVKFSWLLVSTFCFVFNYWVGSFTYQQRFSERFYLIGAWRVAAFLISQVIFLLILFSNQSLDGYFAGMLAGTTFNGTMSIILSLFIWKRYQGFSLLTRQIFMAFKDYRGQVGLILWGNMFGYSKMLHRGADILLVGYFADDRVTGLYKVARSFTDAIYVFFDAMNQVYFPRFMQALSAKDYSVYRDLARKVFMGGGLLVVGLLAAEFIGLSFVVRLILSDKFAGAEGAILVLTVPVFFAIGFHLWYYPAFIHAGKMKIFTGVSLAASVAQYVVAILLFQIFGANPVWAAMGYLTYYLTLTPLVMILIHRINPQLMPFTGLWAANSFFKGYSQK